MSRKKSKKNKEKVNESDIYRNVYKKKERLFYDNVDVINFFQLEKKSTTNYKKQIDLLIAFVPLLIFSILSYGVRSIVIVLLTVSIVCIMDLIFNLVKYHNIKINVEIVTLSFLLGMSFWIQAPLYVVSASAILLYILYFLEKKLHIFLVNLVILIELLVNIVYKYSSSIPVYGVILPVFFSENEKYKILDQQGYDKSAFFDLLIGKYGGLIGSISLCLVLLSLLFLFIRKTISWKFFMSYSITYISFDLIMSLANKTEVSIGSLCYNLLVSGSIFLLIIVSIDQYTLPIRESSKDIFAVFLAILSFFLGTFISAGNSFLISVIICNVSYFIFTHNNYIYNIMQKLKLRNHNGG